MKTVARTTFANISLIAFFGFSVAAHAQACKGVDETRGALVARSNEGVTRRLARGACGLPPAKSRSFYNTLIDSNPWQIAMIRSAVQNPLAHSSVAAALSATTGS